VIHTIKEMGLNTKFKEAMEAVKTATLDLDIAKMAYKQELKKGEGDDTPQQAVGGGKVTPDKSKKLKKAEGEESPQSAVVAAKAALGKARKERNKAQDQVDVLGMLIFQLYGNLLTDEVRQPWEKIVKAQTDTIP
jgi:hypothetical protein